MRISCDVEQHKNDQFQWITSYSWNSIDGQNSIEMKRKVYEFFDIVWKWQVDIQVKL